MDHPGGRSGHIAVTYNDSMIVWGGDKDGVFEDPGFIWVYNIKRNTWRCIQSQNSVFPPPTSGSCVALVHDTVYIFAGFSGSIHGNSNEIYALDVRRISWKKLDVQGKRPSPRNKLSCWTLDSKIIYFGGYGEVPTKENICCSNFVSDNNFLDRGWNSDLVMYDVVKNEWELLSTENEGVRPSPRAAHTCTRVTDEQGYLFGGRFESTRLNDLYTFYFKTYQWSKIVPNDLAPEGRSWHSFIPIDSNTLFLYGGLTTEGEVKSDMWLFKVKTNTWNEIENKAMSSKTNMKRIWHTTCPGVYSGQVVMYGGCSVNIFYGSEHPKDTIIFNLHPLPLQRLALKAVSIHWKNEEKCLPKVLQDELIQMTEN